jgi:hypothetical protein
LHLNYETPEEKGEGGREEGGRGRGRGRGKGEGGSEGGRGSRKRSMECSVELAGMGEGSVVRFSPTVVNASVSASFWSGGGQGLRRARQGVLSGRRSRGEEGVGGGGGCYCVAVGDFRSASRRLQEGVARHFNDLVRRHCERVPSLGVASLSLPCGRPCEGEGGKGAGAPAELVGDEQTQPSGQDEKPRKTVLILMSDTGGGHRASAEAIKATFELEYGDEYKVSVTSTREGFLSRHTRSLPGQSGDIATTAMQSREQGFRVS